jgi:hypothetical protein
MINTEKWHYLINFFVLEGISTTALTQCFVNLAHGQELVCSWCLWKVPPFLKPPRRSVPILVVCLKLRLKHETSVFS